MLVSKKIDDFMLDLKELEITGVRVEAVYILDRESHEEEFSHWTVIIKRGKSYVFKIYNKNHMTSIGQFTYKYFSSQIKMISFIQDALADTGVIC